LTTDSLSSGEEHSMKASTKTLRSESVVPYHRLLSLRGQVDEIDQALSHPSRCTPAPLALTALRKAVQAELDVAERQWRTPVRDAQAA